MKLACLAVGVHLVLKNVEYKVTRNNQENFTLENVNTFEMITVARLQLLDEVYRGSVKLLGKDYRSQKSTRKDNMQSLKNLPDKIKVTVLFRYGFVKSAMTILQTKPTTIGLKAVIKKHAEADGKKLLPSSDSVYKWWKRYYLSGLDILSLANNKSGKAGRTTFPDIVNQELFDVIESEYLIPTRPSAKYVYDIFCNRMNAINSKRLELLPIPSRAHFYRSINKVDKYDATVARFGKKDADRMYRTSLAGPIVSNILQRVEIDHTPLDVFVVDKNNEPVGRPTMTLLLDAYSRMILGIYIGFEPPSLVSVMRALKQAILPKPNDATFMNGVVGVWPAYGIPMILVCDNGSEFHSKTFKELAAELNIDLQFCPKGKPQYKGKVERVLGTLNRDVCQLISGTSFGSIVERADYKPLEHAVVTEEELTKLIYRWIVDVYPHAIHRGTKQSPYDKWMQGLEDILPMLPESKAALSFAMTDEYSRKLTFKGIELFSMYYNNSVLKAMRHKKGESFEVIVRADPEDISHIWVCDPLDGEFVKVPSKSPEYTDGLSYRQHKHVLKRMTEQGLKTNNRAMYLEHKGQLNDDIRALNDSKLIRKKQKAAQLLQKNQETLNSLTSTKSSDVLIEIDDQEEVIDVAVFEIEEVYE
jgi:putative transposase